MIRLVSLNIERSKHLDLVIPFLRSQNADVICLQELMEYDIPRFEEVCGGTYLFAPATRHPAEGKPGIIGTGICSRGNLAQRTESYYYIGDREKIVDFDITDVQTKHKTESHAVVVCDLEKDGDSFRIATTHFTWTPDGKPDDLQRSDIQKLFQTLEPLGELVLVGDFNAPRGGEIFSILAKKYKDNIPERYTTSIDKDLHRAGDLRFMVDGLFSTPGYMISDVQLHSGVSDHLAVTAIVAKT